MRNSFSTLAFGLIFGATPAAADTPELAPPPRPVEPTVRVEALPQGYRVWLNRPAADAFHAALVMAGDEKQLAESLRTAARDRKESGWSPEVIAQLELLALGAEKQLPGLRQAVGEKMGPNGVVIRATGLQRDKVFRKPRPRLEKAFEIGKSLLPEETRATLEGLRSMGRTTPLFWTVEPRE